MKTDDVPPFQLKDDIKRSSSSVGVPLHGGFQFAGTHYKKWP